MSTNKYSLQKTNDYSIFELHEFNRPLHNRPDLLRSMQDNGFMPSSPIQVKKNGNGKLKIIRGHHRFAIAKKLGLPIWYVIDDSVTDIFIIERPGQLWNAEDFANARAQSGDKDCAAILEFQKKHGLTIGSAASLVGGESAGSGNRIKEVKRGTFKKGNMVHANEVISITDILREKNVSFATSTAFVRALSSVLRIPEFDLKAFLHKIEIDYMRLRKRGTQDEYLEEIEAFYNYAAHPSKRIPIAFRAKEVSRKRQETFGKSS